jgi:hypothetical protein
MFLWTDPFSRDLEKQRGPDHQGQGAAGLVSARWLALDAILRSLILDPEGPEMRAMMRRDLHLIHATGRVAEKAPDYVKPFIEAAEVLGELKKTLT